MLGTHQCTQQHQAQRGKRHATMPRLRSSGWLLHQRPECAMRWSADRPLTSSRNLFETSHPRRPWRRSCLRPPCFLRGLTSLAPPSGEPVSTAALQASTRFPRASDLVWARHRKDPRHCCSRKDVAVMPSQSGDDARRRSPARCTVHRFRHPCIAPRDYLCTLLRDQCPRRELPSE